MIRSFLKCMLSFHLCSFIFLRFTFYFSICRQLKLYAVLKAKQTQELQPFRTVFITFSLCLCSYWHYYKLKRKLFLTVMNLPLSPQQYFFKWYSRYLLMCFLVPNPPFPILCLWTNRFTLSLFFFFWHFPLINTKKF